MDPEIRVVKCKYENPEDWDYWYEMRRVTYDRDGTISTIGAHPIDPHAQTLDGVDTLLQQMLAARTKPVIDFDTRQEI